MDTRISMSEYQEIMQMIYISRVDIKISMINPIGG